MGMINVYTHEDAVEAARRNRDDYVSQVQREIEALQNRKGTSGEIARLRYHLTEQYLAEQFPLAYDG